jgi:cytochrome c556
MRTLLATSALLLTGVLCAQVATYQNVATTKDIMLTMAIPASNALFDAGSKEKLSEQEWAEYRKQAILLAESGNLLAMPGRISTGASKGRAKANPAGWQQAAKMLRDAGKLALTAVDKKDQDLLSGDVGEKILNSCAACHEKYMIK